MPVIYSYQDADLFFHYSIDDHPYKADFVMHTHEFCELYLFLSGKGVFKVEGNEYPLSPGDVLVMKPFESHFIDIDESQSYERIAFHFRKDLLLTLEASGSLTDSVLHHQPGHDNRFDANIFSAELYPTILCSLKQKNNLSRTKIVAHLMMLLYEIGCQQSNTIQQTDTLKDTISHKITTFIMQHIEEPLSLERICKEFYISKSTLCKVFLESTGSTVQNYVITKKMSHAKWLMHTGMHPTAVAAACGFSDYSNFYRSFKKHYGISPMMAFKSVRK